MTESSGSDASPSKAKDRQVKFPVQVRIPDTEERSSLVKSFTVYIIHVSDFGRTFQVERRFDDFAKLHGELVSIDPTIPAIPEKKMWASTDVATVAERRPAFEKMLRHMLHNEDIVMDKAQDLWKFLELPPPAVVASRYMFKGQRFNYARQCGKLLDPKYEEDHAYRLSHEAMIKTNLHLIVSEIPQANSEIGKGVQTENVCAADEVAKSGSSASAPAVSSENSGPHAERSTSEPGVVVSTEFSKVAAIQDAEAAAFEMIRYALANGGSSVRKTFLDQNGMSVMLGLLFWKGRQENALGHKEVLPNPQIRSLMNALVKAEGSEYPQVFAKFLASGGVTLLSSARDVIQANPVFAEFLAKLLWIAWAPSAQAAFMDSAHGKEALGLISNLFDSQSLIARVCAGLLLSCLLTGGLLESKEDTAASGLHALVVDISASSPAWLPKAGDGENSTTVSSKAESDLVGYLNTLNTNEERLNRIIECADAPWRLNGDDIPDEGNPLWASCAFALWCLLRMRPQPAKLAGLRRALPAVTQAAPDRARWLAGELLLYLQLQVPERLGVGNQADGGLVAITCNESVAVETALRDQVAQCRQLLRDQLEDNQRIVFSQRALTEERQRPPSLAQKNWHDSLETLLRELSALRLQLPASLTNAEVSGETAFSSVKYILQMDLEDTESEITKRELAVKLEGMREIETNFLEKQREHTRCQKVVADQEKRVEEANEALETADKRVASMRQSISDTETAISSKQRDAQNKRTMASSDLSSLKGQTLAEIDKLKVQQLKLRERASKIQAAELLGDDGQPIEGLAAHEQMSTLKAEAAKIKSRLTDYQAELSRMELDPATLEQQASTLEDEVIQLSKELESSRLDLQSFEGDHAERRQFWQAAVSDLQAARQRCQVAERECSGLKQQLDTVWASWRPLHCKRMELLRSRAGMLAQAQQGGKQLSDDVCRGWNDLRAERDLRRQVTSAILDLQSQLNNLSQEFASVDDTPLDSSEEQLVDW